VERILDCSYDPMFLKSLYGVLRGEDFEIDEAAHAAHAVQLAFNRGYAAIIFDSSSIGLSVDDATQIINQEIGEMPVIIAGGAHPSVEAMTISKPLDLAEVKQAIQTVRKLKTTERRV
jgi:DNA-binding NtrC family response regulator